MLAYDVTKLETFQNLEKVWLKEVLNYSEPDVIVILVGN